MRLPCSSLPPFAEVSMKSPLCSGMVVIALTVTSPQATIVPPLPPSAETAAFSVPSGLAALVPSPVPPSFT